MNHLFKFPGVSILVVVLFAPALALATDKPRIWVTTDLMKGPAGDEDDDVCMAALLLMADHYTIEGISVNANPNYVEGTDQWALETFIADYKQEVGRLNAWYDNQYQLEIPVHMASTAGKRFENVQTQATEPDFLDNYPAIRGIVDAAAEGPLYVLNWGPVTEVAMLLKYCEVHDKTATLKNVTIVSHWTQRGGPWNCAADNEACHYVHDQAETNPNVVMYELGPSGQHGLVENITQETAVLNSEVMFASRIGKHMDAKWTRGCGRCKGMPDMSDASTMLVLIGFGGGLEAYNNDGTTTDQEAVNALLCGDRADIFARMEERASVAAGALKK